jgi:hypothetical protein
MNWKSLGFYSCLASVLGSIGIFFGQGNEMLGVFVGLWAPTLLLLSDRIEEILNE